jgi:hypothetical protein
MFHRLALCALLLGIAGGFAPPTARALPLISEVFYDAVGSDDGRSFVELYGAPGTLLDGLRLEGVNGSGGGIGPVVALSGAIPADGFFVVADDLAGGPTLVANADLVLNFDFQNGPDSIVLRSGAGVLDAVGYGVFASSPGRGRPRPTRRRTRAWRGSWPTSTRTTTPGTSPCSRRRRPARAISPPFRSRRRPCSSAQVSRGSAPARGGRARGPDSGAAVG